MPVRLDKLPVGLDGFTIVQLSDVHLGLFVGDQELESMMELVARAKPDLIALTGDLIDSDPRYMDALGRMAVPAAASAPAVAAPGTRASYAGIARSRDALRRAGVNALVNAAHHPSPRHEGLAVLGVDDMWSRRYGEGRGPDVERAAADLDPDAPRILLCHNPAYFAEAAPHVDLQISGHTHGGQFNPGVRPADLVLPYGYVAGRYERDGAVLWVNRGFGTAGPPSRLGSAPEVTRIGLTS